MTIAAVARRLGAKLALDYSGEALRHAVSQGGIQLLKPSLSELSFLAGRTLDSEGEQEAAARELVEQGRVEIVVLSLGARGALLASREGVERFPAFEVPLRSAVGAGDSLVGATVRIPYTFAVPRAPVWGRFQRCCSHARKWRSSLSA